MRMPTPRCARQQDLPAITELLAAAQLTSDGVAEHLDAFLVAEAEGAVVGVGGLELYGSVALLRSLAVAARHRRRGFAGAICDGLEAEAARRGVEALYLLTETADGFFARRGYAVAARDDAPPAIRTSAQFATLCPKSAVLMCRRSV
jgi:amino-acid N-acetyltransferase